MVDLAFSFDGRGMNDANDPYRARIATFAPAYVGKDGKAIGQLWEAAPELLAALERIVSAFGMTDDVEQKIFAADIAAARATIAKAKSGA